MQALALTVEEREAKAAMAMVEGLILRSVRLGCCLERSSAGLDLEMRVLE